MKKLYFNNQLVLKGGIGDFLNLLHQFIGAEIRTTDKENYFLILND